MNWLTDLITKPQIGKTWDDGEFYYSIVDLLSELLHLSPKETRNYYFSLKKKITQEHELTPKKLKVPASDGKSYLTDVVTLGQFLHIILYISSPEINQIRSWIAEILRSHLGSKSIENKLKFLEMLKDRVLDAPPTLYIEADENLYQGLWQRTTAQLTGELKIDKKANPRDSFGKYALIYTRLAEDLATEKLGNAETVSMAVAMDIVWEIAKMIGSQAKQVSETLGYDLVTEKPLLNKSKKKE